MAKPYGDDLRGKFLLAYDRGEDTLEELADRFLVSVGWAKKISAQRNRSGQAERVPHQAGRKWRAGAEAQRQVMDWVASKPDLTLAQLQARLYNEAGISLSLGRVWHLLKKLGLRLKKVTARGRARHRSQPRAPRRVRGAHPVDLAGAADFPGRERRHYLDDATLRASHGRQTHP
jgi:transposase